MVTLIRPADAASTQLSTAPETAQPPGTDGPEFAEWVVDLTSHRIVRRPANDQRRPNS